MKNILCLIKTFSRGIPVTESQITDLFSNQFADCFKEIQMQENVVVHGQFLYATRVLRSIQSVLVGNIIVKLRTNGKNILVRK